MSDSRIDASLVTEDGVRHILSFLPRLSARGVNFGESPRIEDADKNRVSLLPATLSETVLEFVHACYDENFVQSFDWSEWSHQHQAELSDEAFIAFADIARIVRLLTTHIRADRFCDGHLLSVFEDGTIVRILKRLKEISSEQLSAAYPRGRADSPSGSAEA